MLGSPLVMFSPVKIRLRGKGQSTLKMTRTLVAVAQAVISTEARAGAKDSGEHLK